MKLLNSFWNDPAKAVILQGRRGRLFRFQFYSVICPKEAAASFDQGAHGLGFGPRLRHSDAAAPDPGLMAEERFGCRI